ncbi:MAG TPA: hypothetical protein VN038_13845 [Dyadobacter sp.]|nr:hypothetical protein [Dyadobacter sp.]
MSEFVEAYVKANDAGKTVIANDSSEYFGLAVPASTLVPEGNAYLGETRFQEYLRSFLPQA